MSSSLPFGLDCSWLFTDLFGSRSITDGSLPSLTRAFLTAPIGNPIFNILKNFSYSGSSFNIGPSSPPPLSFCNCDLRDLLGSRSIIEGSLLSLTTAFFTAPIGNPILSILKYFTYSGSSLKSGSPSELTLFSGFSSFDFAITAAASAVPLAFSSPGEFSSLDFVDSVSAAAPVAALSR